MSASYLNGYRTAAANAIAVSSLARSDAAVLGVIGAGHQAEQEIRAVAEVRALSWIKISTRSETRASWIADRLKDVDVSIRLTSAEDAVRGSDIVVTVTPSESRSFGTNGSGKELMSRRWALMTRASTSSIPLF